MLAITWYQWFLFFHILGAIVMVGGALTLFALAIAARKTSDPAHELALIRLAGKIGGPFFGISGFALLGFGIGLVENGNWGYDHVFIEWGFAVWAFSTLLGIVFYSRQEKRLDAAEAKGGAAALRRQLDRYYWVGRVDALSLVSAVFVMATKPWL
jgi:uncharacterized membrane protein